LLNNEKREQKMLAWAWFGLWGFVTATLWVPSRDGLEVVFGLGLLIPLLLVIPWRRPDFNSYGGWYTVIALGYAGWSLITSFWGDGINFFILQWFILALWLTGCCLVFQQRVVQWDKVYQYLLVIGSLSALLNIIVFYLDHPFSTRLTGVTITRAPTLVGQTYGVVALVAILLSWKTNNFKHALLFSCASVPTLAALGLSQSRGPLFSLAIVLVIGVVWLRPFWKLLLLQVSIAFVLLLTLLAVLPVRQLLAERGASERDLIWSLLWSDMIEKPSTFIWGMGMSKSTHFTHGIVEYHHAHNAWLDILYRTGVIGLGLALIHLGWLLWNARKQRHLAPLVLWLIYGCGCLLVDSRVLFWEIDVKWFMYWIPAGLLTAMLVQSPRDTTLSSFK